MSYQVGKDYTVTMERKNAIGMWSRRFVTLKGLQLSIAESEGGAAQTTLSLTNVGRVAGEPLCLSFVGAETVVLRCADAATMTSWLDLTYTALEMEGKVKPRNGGLPPNDPRNGLRFIEVPPEYHSNFPTLHNMVLYWFEPIKKFGALSKFTGRPAVEERIGFVTDQCLYITKSTSDLTRCIKISTIKKLFTNFEEVKGRPAEEAFLVVKVPHPDYDFYFSAKNIQSCVETIATVFKQVTKGRVLPVDQVKTFTDPAVALQLERPAEFKMTLVVPTPKDVLKAALDKYAAANGIAITSTGAATRAKTGSVPPNAGSPGSGPAKAGGAPVAAGPSAAASAPPLQKLLTALNLMQYHDKLKKQMVDLEVLEIADDDDMINFGITDKAHMKLLRQKLGDADFMQTVLSGGAPAPGGATAPGAGSPTAAPPTRATFDDIDDFDLPMPAKAPAAAAAAPNFDFDDLDLDLPPPKAAAPAFVFVDDDLDLDLPPPKPAPKPAAALADLDDI